MDILANIEDENRFMVDSDDDLVFEEDIIRNSFSVKHWLRFVEHKKNAKCSNEAINIVYERALKQLPGSYKLWKSYLDLRREQVKSLSISSNEYKDVNNCFERALVFMHKMPRIWLDYCQFLINQMLVTRTRRTFDRCLQSLPITQHTRIWPLYLQFINMHDIPQTAIRVYKRYLKLQPEDAEDFIEFLLSIGKLDEAAVKLAEVVNRDDFLSKEGKSKHQLWSELCNLISKNPDKVQSLKVDPIIREGIKRYTDQQGKLWNSLAEYYTRSGLFEKARDIYEEALLNVMTIRDFSQVFDSYAQNEEKLINAKMQNSVMTEDDDIELELRLSRYEDLIERRPLLLNSVALRQNPHNVDEWLKRIQLLEGKPLEIINTFTDAVQTVDAKLAIGKVSTLWVNFAKFYEENDQVEDARIIFEKATDAPFTKVEDLANIWCEWAEMELRKGNHKESLRIMQKATAVPSKKASYFDQNEPVQNRIYKNLKIWSLYADLEESFGTFKTTKAVYDRIIELRIATPQIIINFALFLEESNYFEEAFKAYEKGIALFKWPNVFDIWITYLNKFLERYNGAKLERARDLFEQCLEKCPAEYAKPFYLLFAKLEENFGLAKHAMAVYDRATTAVKEEDRFEMFNIYIRKAAEMFGVTYTRQIYEKAIEVLPDDQAREMYLKFADLECKLGEIDRARAIYAHCSQICDPRTQQYFWNIWKEFEIKHGNEDTIREMLRIKRSLQATFNTQVNFMSAQMIAAVNVTDKVPSSMELIEESVSAAEKTQKKFELKENKDIVFVKSTTDENRAVDKSANPDEIDIDDEEESEDEEEEGIDKDMENVRKPIKKVVLEQTAVPKEVFGGLRDGNDSD
ncbi:pre-mRNA splicing factor Syf1-like protein [Leptotrombidium deliense]|uniref:Pre-mRNA splicing factor Syf1-like protein n=1 Tax=Leptotrombidium deliense TaxID=299467 RepID=A0A443SV32_9ACAR|nr:pre-mRNA splicing factor Syf1-like protein [Leptotrombidium deliense]